MNNKSILLFTILLGLHSPLFSATVTVVGSNGSAGFNGSPGDPGTPGVNGESGASAVAISITNNLNQDTDNFANATGGNGGIGGNGGAGVNVSPSLWAPGGNGGNGGRGGDASALASTTINSLGAPLGIRAGASARGGNGSNGGLAGIQSAADSIFDGFSGQDGSGGQGGNASASASARDLDTNFGQATATAFAIGGTGGDITPNNRLGLSLGFEPVGFSAAGDGGSASLGTVYAESLNRGNVTATGSVAGGNGGSVNNNTQSGGSAAGAVLSGNGASVSITDAVDGSTEGNMLLEQNATGGAGGRLSTQTGYGTLGSAGSASSLLSKTTTSSNLTVRTRATGGAGGIFAIVNLIPVGGLPPNTGGATGGDGAAATANSSAINLGGNATAVAIAVGGEGGRALSQVETAGETRGGAGGRASATAYAESVGGTAIAEARQSGGIGFNGGNGGNSIMENSVSGSSDILLELRQISTGGEARFAAPENRTFGGNASSSLTTTNAGGGDIFATIEAVGGGISSSFNVGRGGDAYVAADLTTQGNINAIARSRAGRGLTGGSATLGPVRATSLNGGGVVVTGEVYAGTDQSISLIDAVDGVTTGVLSLRQFARGGQIESESGTGDAFNSLTKVATGIDSLFLGTRTEAGNVFSPEIVNAGINGGIEGGRGTANTSGTNTGNSSFVQSSAFGGAGGGTPASSSRAFFRTAGKGGDAFSRSDAIVLDADSQTTSSASSESTGGQGGGIIPVAGVANLTSGGGDGGFANSVSTATSTVDFRNRFQTTSSRSTAMGGQGAFINSERIAQGGNGGDAFAQATSIVNSQGTSFAIGRNPVTAEAVARGGSGGGNSGSGLGGRGGNAVAVAEVIGAINASSTAVASPGGGQGNTAGLASATARITNGSGVAQAEIRRNFVNATNRGLVTQASVTATRRGGVAPLSGSNIEASITTGNLTPAAPAASLRSASTVLSATATNSGSELIGLESVARVSVSPDATAVNQALSGNSGVAGNFNPAGGSDILLLMSIGAFQDGSNIGNSFSNTVNLSLDMSQLATQQDLMFGFMNPVFTGNGFDSMTFQIFQEDSLVIDELFSDVFSAESFFTDQTLNLGDWTQGLNGDLDLAFLVGFNISQIGDGFYFDTISGNSTIGSGVVPVPAAVWLFGSGLIGLLSISRRNTKSRTLAWSATSRSSPT